MNAVVMGGRPVGRSDPDWAPSADAESSSKPRAKGKEMCRWVRDVLKFRR
jgi:hypothetical protein